MATLDSIIKELNGLIPKSADSAAKNGEYVTKNVADLNTALKKLRNSYKIKKKRIAAESEAAREAAYREKAAKLRDNGQKKREVENESRVRARNKELINFYKGITGAESEGDKEDVLEKALAEKGVLDREHRDTVYDLELKEAAAEAKREAEKKLLDEERKSAEQNLTEQTRNKLESLARELREEQRVSDLKDRADGEGGLSDDELFDICNYILTSSYYKGYLYRSMVNQRYKELKESGNLTESDLARIRKLLKIKEGS